MAAPVKAGKAVIDEFIAQAKIAVVGVSRDRNKFGNIAYRNLRDKGYHVLAVNPNIDRVEGEPCYPSLAALPEAVGGVVIVVPPRETEKVVREAEAAGIRRVWLQPGAESPGAIAFCESHGLAVVHGECIMMFAPPVRSVHRFHRGVRGLFGQLPK